MVTPPAGPIERADCRLQQFRALRDPVADYETALHAGHDPDRISFVAALRINRQSVALQGAFPP